jgi:type I restriction enzyme M protein
VTGPQENARVTVSEIAQLAGVSVSAVSNWRKRYADFPVPADGTAAGDLFAVQEVLAWLERRGKKVRKPKEQGLQQLLAGVSESLRGEGAPNEARLLAMLQVLTIWRFSVAVTTGGVAGPASAWAKLTTAPVAELPVVWQHAIESVQLGEASAVREVLESPAISWRGIQQLVAAVDRLADEGMRDASPRVFGEAVSLVIFQLQESQAIRVFGSTTPKSLAALMVRLLSPMGGTIYDPAAGHAMVLAEAARATSGEHIRLVGQEVSEFSWRVGVLQLALCGFTASLDRGDTLQHDAFRGQEADRIILDPPLNARLGSTDIVFDPRWKYGTSNVADWMWAQHLVQHLAPNGIGVMVVSKGSLSRSGRDAMIRARLIEAGELDAVIALPPGLVAGSNVAIALLLFDRTRVGNRGDVLFIDARQLGMSRRGLISDLTPEAISRIADAVRAWRSGQSVSEPTFAAVASASEILGGTTAAGDQEDHVDLTPHRFIRYVAETDQAGALEQMEEIKATLEASRQALGETIELQFAVDMAALCLTVAQEEWPAVRLRDVLEERPVVGSRPDPDGSEEERPFVSTSFVTHSGGKVDRLPEERTRGKRKVRGARHGDVLLASRGIDASSRRVSCATVYIDADLSFSDSLLLLTPRVDLLDSDYLRYTLTSDSGVAALAALSTGTTIANIRPDALMELEVRVPPLVVQKQIVTSLREVEKASEKLASATQQVSDLFSLLRNGATGGLLAPGESLEVVAESPSSRDPLIYPVGVLVEGEVDAPRGHHWFRNDREALAWYLDTHVIPMLSRRGAQDKLSAVRYAQNWAEKRGGGLALTVSSINAATAPLMSVSWVGTFDELRGGSTAHARYLCAEFWEALQDDGTFRLRCRPDENIEEQSGIADKDVETFIAMIKALDES